MEQTTSSDFITTTEEVSGIEVGRVDDLLLNVNDSRIVSVGELSDDEEDDYQDEDEQDDNQESSRSNTHAAAQAGNSFNFPSLLQNPSSTTSANHDHSYASNSSKHLPHEALLRKIHLLELSLAEAQNLAGLKTRALEEQIVLLTGVVDAQKREIREKDQEISKLILCTFCLSLYTDIDRRTIHM